MNEGELRKELTGISREKLIDMIVELKKNTQYDLRTISNRNNLIEKLESKIRRMRDTIHENPLNICSRCGFVECVCLGNINRIKQLESKIRKIRSILHEPL